MRGFLSANGMRVPVGGIRSSFLVTQITHIADLKRYASCLVTWSRAEENGGKAKALDGSPDPRAPRRFFSHCFPQELSGFISGGSGTHKVDAGAKDVANPGKG